ncbi:MAG: hypothetical protein J6V11_01710, partial [Alphaproteobacteria bacterium]|nr:hypothetical protein [Alphaproteobacteria bacterium]
MAVQNFNNNDINITGFHIKCGMTGMESARSTPSLSSLCLTRGAIRFKCRFFTLMCGMLVMSTIALA